MKRETLNAFFTVRTDRLLCTSEYAYAVLLCKLSNQNLTIQATESDKWYSRSTVFNVFEGQTERFVANFVWLLSNSPLSSKLYMPHDFRLCKITTVNDIQNGSIRPCIVHGTGTLVTRYLRIHIYWTHFWFKKKILDSTNCVSSKPTESRPCTCAVEHYE